MLEACCALHRRYGTEVTYLPVGHDGRVDPQDLADAITPQTTLVSIMAANNETGVMQPLDALARITCQHGGGQERGLRGGTENVALAVGLGDAADLARHELADDGPRRLQELRDLLYRRLNDHLPGRVRLTGRPAQRLPGTLHISIIGVRGDDLLAATPAIAAATGSACHAHSREPSPVLLAMPQDRDQALSALRLSLGRWTTRPDVERAAEAIAMTAHRLLAPTAAP